MTVKLLMAKLEQVYERGLDFYSDPDSVRPNMIPESWGLARVNFFICAKKRTPPRR